MPWYVIKLQMLFASANLQVWGLWAIYLILVILHGTVHNYDCWVQMMLFDVWSPHSKGHNFCIHQPWCSQRRKHNHKYFSYLSFYSVHDLWMNWSPLITTWQLMYDTWTISYTRTFPPIQGDGHYEGILPKEPYLPCVSMAGRALLAGYPRLGMLDSRRKYLQMLPYLRRPFRKWN